MHRNRLVKAALVVQKYIPEHFRRHVNQIEAAINYTRFNNVPYTACVETKDAYYNYMEFDVMQFNEGNWCTMLICKKSTVYYFTSIWNLHNSSCSYYVPKMSV